MKECVYFHKSDTKVSKMSRNNKFEVLKGTILHSANFLQKNKYELLFIESTGGV